MDSKKSKKREKDKLTDSVNKKRKVETEGKEEIETPERSKKDACL
jgi:hypothetical protein